MPKENYSLQFKKDAVALYEDNVDLSLASAAQDLGVNRSYVVCMGAKAWHGETRSYGSTAKASKANI